MKSTELRIGNLLQFKNSQHIAIVELIHSHHVVGCRSEQGVFMPNVGVEPILLTEEWLLKLGFYKSIENSGNLICYKKGDITIGWWLGQKWQLWIGTKDIRKSPQYVHQLQNIYFALTGEELIIKQQL